MSIINAHRRRANVVTAIPTYIGRYLMDETTGTTMVDSSGNNNNGVNDVGVAIGATGRIGSGYTYGATNAITELPTLQNVWDKTDFTILLWINPNTIAGVQKYFANHLAGTLGTQIGFSIGTNGAQFGATFLQDGFGNSVQFNGASTALLTVNAWNHIAMRWDASTGNARLYINGVQRQSITNNAMAGATLSSLIPTVGGRFDAVQLYVGDMDLLKIHTRALSNTEITTDYNLGNGTIN